MGALQNANPRRAFATGALLIWMMPADLIIMFTVGVNLVHHDASAVAALPLLAYVLFRGRAQRLMPKVRDWMNTHSWLVRIVTYVVFILLILS